MTTIATPRVFIAGTSSGVGKSFFTVGLAAALVQRGLSVNVCLHSVRLLQAVLYRRICLRHPCILDPRLLTPLQILEEVQLASAGADIVLVDGNLGLFDGQGPTTLEGSDAWLAELLGAPTIVLFDAGIFAASAGAVVKGFSGGTFHQFPIEGAVANWLDLDGAPFRDRAFYEAALAAFGAPPLLGALRTLPSALEPENTLPARSVSQDRNRTLLGRLFILELGKLVAESVDIDAIVAIAGHAPRIQLEEEGPLPGRRCRIAFSDDSCFHLGFPDNLTILRHYGAELVPFSPLADTELPPRIGGIYFTGAYLREYGADLAANIELMAAMRDFVERGGVLYAEGGGTAFLCTEFQVDSQGNFLPGVGLLPGRAIFATGQIDYLSVQMTDCSVVGVSGAVMQGVDSFEWAFEATGSPPSTAFQETSPRGARMIHGMAPLPGVTASFAFLHWGSHRAGAQRFVEAAEFAARRLKG